MKETRARRLSPRQCRAVLDALSRLPISTWRYKHERARVRHIGPMAQDFAAAFRVGGDNRRIALIDAVGVAYAAIQALHDAIAERRAEIAALEKRVAALRRRVRTRP